MPEGAHSGDCEFAGRDDLNGLSRGGSWGRGNPGRWLVAMTKRERHVREQKIIQARDHQAKTFEQIGIAQGVSRQRAWQIYQKAVARRYKPTKGLEG